MADKKISALTAASTPLAGTEVLPVVQSSATVKVSVANLTDGRVVDTAGLAVTNYAGAVAAINVSGAGTLPARIRVVSTTSAGASLVLRDSGTTNNVTLASSGQSLVVSTGGVQRIELDGAGDTALKTGNLIQGTAAKGVNFTANTPAAGMTSQLLNWYEEGTHTATMTPETSGTITLESSVNKLYYTRVGRIVTVTGLLQVNSVSLPVGNYVSISLPFTIANNYAARSGSAAVSNQAGTYSNKVLLGVENTAAVRMYISAATIAAADQFSFAFSFTV